MSSLSVLLGDNSTKEEDSDSATPETSGTAQELEDICRAIIDSFNDRSTTRLAEIGRQHFRPDFKSSLDNARRCSTMDEFVKFVGFSFMADPSAHHSVKDIHVDVNEEFGHADVYMTLEMTGVGGDLVRLSLCVVRWRRRETKWIGYQAEVIRGMAGVAIGE